MHYKLFVNDLLLLLQRLGVGISIGHIDCSSLTCADDFALLATILICLQLLLLVVKYYIGRERYGINAQKSSEVGDFCAYILGVTSKFDYFYGLFTKINYGFCVL